MGYGNKKTHLEKLSRNVATRCSSQAKIIMYDYNVGVEESIMSKFCSLCDVKSLIRPNLIQKPRKTYSGNLYSETTHLSSKTFA